MGKVNHDHVCKILLYAILRKGLGFFKNPTTAA